MIPHDNQLAYNKKTTEEYTQFGDMTFKGDIALFAKLEHINLKDADILDFGCGNGRIEKKLLSKNPASIVGMEISEPMLEEANKLLATYSPEDTNKVSFTKIESDTLPFADNSFDVILVHFVFHYIKNPQAIMSELCRVLRPGGKLVATFNDFIFAKGYEHLENTVLPILIKSTLAVDVLGKTRESICAEMKSAGFTLEQVDNFENSARINPIYEYFESVSIANTVIVATNNK